MIEDRDHMLARTSASCYLGQATISGEKNYTIRSLRDSDRSASSTLPRKSRTASHFRAQSKFMSETSFSNIRSPLPMEVMMASNRENLS